jgi:hypothetical protein
MLPTRTAAATVAACLAAVGVSGQQTDVFDRVKHGYAVSEAGVKIHCGASLEPANPEQRTGN